MTAWKNILASVAWPCFALVCHCSSVNTGACVIDLKGSSVVLMLVGILNTGLWNVQSSCTVQSIVLRHRGSCLIYLLWLCSVHRISQVENTFLLAKNLRTYRSMLCRAVLMQFWNLYSFFVVSHFHNAGVFHCLFYVYSAGTEWFVKLCPDVLLHGFKPTFLILKSYISHNKWHILQSVTTEINCLMFCYIL